MDAGVNKALLCFVATSMTKGQVVALQQLCTQPDVLVKEDAEAIMFGVDGAREIVEAAAAEAIKEADAAKRATEIVLQDSVRGRFVYMLEKAARPGVADAIFVLAATLDLENDRDSWAGYEQILIDYGIIDDQGGFIDDAEEEIKALCLESVDLSKGELTNPDTKASIAWR